MIKSAKVGEFYNKTKKTGMRIYQSAKNLIYR